MSNTKTTTTKMSNEVAALVNFIKANPNKEFTFAELCEGAKVPCKTGYLAGIRHALGDDFSAFGEKEIIVPTKRKVKTYSFGTPTDSDKQ